MKVCHVTDAHSPFDDRIYLKECISLSQAGYDTYIVARGEECIREGVHIIGCGIPKSRADRILFFSNKIYRKAVYLNCDIYHFHDPELLPYALRLKRKGKKVIFDSHEDIPSQILDKEWIPRFFRKWLSNCYRLYETYVVKRIDAVVAATPYIAKQFERRARKTTIVNNYPKLDDVIFHNNSFEKREAIICYAGGISKARGEQVMIEAMKNLDAILVLAGEHEKLTLEKVEYLGQVDRQSINALYARAVAGLVLLLPTSSYVNSLPVKMFEYMAAGLPFVASDFVLWREIIDKYHCGLYVPIDNQERIQQAISYLLTHRKDAERMGKYGRQAVEIEYNWDREKTKLIGLYKIMIK